MASNEHILITCEHGGNHIPSRYRRLFSGYEALLQTHRGYDAGALVMARELARSLGASLFVASTSRLLVDLNRSIGHPRLYSEATREAPAMLRREILQRHYLPYRHKVEADICAALQRGSRVIHIASHSFTPELDGEVRNADIGLLYDPDRGEEAALCRNWKMQLKAVAPYLKVRRNYPYTGRSDGFACYLRRSFPAASYLGIELEINQKHVLEGGRHWRTLRLAVVNALLHAISPSRA